MSQARQTFHASRSLFGLRTETVASTSIRILTSRLPGTIFLMQNDSEVHWRPGIKCIRQFSACKRIWWPGYVSLPAFAAESVPAGAFCNQLQSASKLACRQKSTSPCPRALDCQSTDCGGREPYIGKAAAWPQIDRLNDSLCQDYRSTSFKGHRCSSHEDILSCLQSLRDAIVLRMCSTLLQSIAPAKQGDHVSTSTMTDYTIAEDKTYAANTLRIVDV